MPMAAMNSDVNVSQAGVRLPNFNAPLPPPPATTTPIINTNASPLAVDVMEHPIAPMEAMNETVHLTVTTAEHPVIATATAVRDGVMERPSAMMEVMKKTAILVAMVVQLVH